MLAAAAVRLLQLPMVATAWQARLLDRVLAALVKVMAGTVAIACQRRLRTAGREVLQAVAVAVLFLQVTVLGLVLPAA